MYTSVDQVRQMYHAAVDQGEGRYNVCLGDDASNEGSHKEITYDFLTSVTFNLDSAHMVNKPVTTTTNSPSLEPTFNIHDSFDTWLYQNAAERKRVH